MGSNQSRGLIIASKTRGWDPTKIPGAESILPNFDKDRGNIYYEGAQVGQLPDGTPDGWHDGHDVMGVPGAGVIEPTYNTSQTDGQKPARATRGADPYPGFGGEGY